MSMYLANAVTSLFPVHYASKVWKHVRGSVLAGNGHGMLALAPRGYDGIKPASSMRLA